MSCARIAREVIEFFRFGDLDARSAPHLDHLAVCAACRDEVGLDRELVVALQRAIGARVDGHAASPGAWLEIRRRALQPEPPTWRVRLLPVFPSRPGRRGRRPGPRPPRPGRWLLPFRVDPLSTNVPSWSRYQEAAVTIRSTRTTGVVAGVRHRPAPSPAAHARPCGRGPRDPAGHVAERWSGPASDPLRSPSGGRCPHRLLMLAACMSGGGTPSNPSASAGPTTSAVRPVGRRTPPPDPPSAAARTGEAVPRRDAAARPCPRAGLDVLRAAEHRGGPGHLHQHPVRLEPQQLYSPVVQLEWAEGGNVVYTRAGRFFPPGDRPGRHHRRLPDGRPADPGIRHARRPRGPHQVLPDAGHGRRPGVPLGVTDGLGSGRRSVTVPAPPRAAGNWNMRPWSASPSSPPTGRSSARRIGLVGEPLGPGEQRPFSINGGGSHRSHRSRHRLGRDP